VFALLLLGHVAQQAAHRQGIAGLLPLAQAQFKFQHAAIGRMVAQGRAIHRLAIQGAAEERTHLAAARRKEMFEGIQFQQRGCVLAEAALPGRIGIQETSPPG
jgi:hypothetical protein